MWADRLKRVYARRGRAVDVHAARLLGDTVDTVDTVDARDAADASGTADAEVTAVRASRPHVLASVAMSLDGYIDDAGAGTLVLSDAADLDRVDEIRAGVDAILVGAGTVRADNPRLLVRSADRRDDRVAAGRPPSPLRVVLSASGDLDPSAAVFTRRHDVPPTLVHTASPAVAGLRTRLGDAAEVVDAGDPPGPAAVLAGLAERGVERLMVEGGGAVHTAFLTAGLVDELQVVVAPFFVGDTRAPRFVHDGGFPQGPDHRMRLVEARPIGDLVLLRYEIRGP